MREEYELEVLEKYDIEVKSTRRIRGAFFCIGSELKSGLPSSITGVYQGLLLFFILACDTMIFYRLSWRGHSADAGKEVR